MGKRSKDTKKFKGYAMPKCGDDFIRPIPTGFGKDSDDSDSQNSDKNHWKIVFDAHREEDENECEHWKDEVNNLIIFAGLFSAIVTAFLIESYKFLLPEGSPDPGKFGLDHGHAVRLNSLWFCSLVLSLSMVVIGIVALQWLRDHQRYHNIKPRDALSVLEVRRKALKSWNIRAAFLSLPLLILVALVLFFVGLVDFLLTLNKAVAAPVGVLIYATIAILFVTTVLPSCQIFWIYISNRRVESDEDVPVPCPYKSPQSLLLLRFLSFLVRRWPGAMMRKPPSNKTPQTDHVDVSPRRMPLYLLFYEALDNWSHYDTRWLRLRDIYSQSAKQKTYDNSSRSLLHPRRPIFDEAQILRWTLEELNPSASVLFAAYHCFREVSKNALYDKVDSEADYYAPQPPERNQILRGYYWGHLPPSEPVSGLLGTQNKDLLQDENMLVFLQTQRSHNLPDEASRVISGHLCELQTRILSYTYTTDPAPCIKRPGAEDAKENSKHEWLLVMLRQYIDMIESTTGPPKFKISSHFTSSSINGSEISVSHDTIKMAIIQFSQIFVSFVRQIDKPQSLPWDENVVYAHKDVVQIWKVPGAMLRYTGTNQRPFDAFAPFEQAFGCIRSSLSLVSNSAADDPESSEDRINQTNADYLFLSTCALINELFDPYGKLHLHPFKPQQSSLMASLVETARHYEREEAALARIRANRSKFWAQTGLPDEPFEFDTSYDHQGIGLRVKRSYSYIRWDCIPSWMHIVGPEPAPDNEGPPS